MIWGFNINIIIFDFNEYKEENCQPDRVGEKYKNGILK